MIDSKWKNASRVCAYKFFWLSRLLGGKAVRLHAFKKLAGYCRLFDNT